MGKYRLFNTGSGGWLARFLLAAGTISFALYGLPPLLVQVALKNHALRHDDRLATATRRQSYTQLYWAVKLSPHENPDWLFLLGRAALLAQDLSAAQKAFEEAIQLKPNLPEVHREYARVLLVMGGESNLKKALAELNEEIKWYPENIGAYYTRGLVNGSLKRWREAEQDFLTVTRSAPDDEWGYNDLAWVYFSQGKWQEAEQAARQSVTINAGFMWGHNGLGLALMNQGRYSEAIDHLEKAMTLAKVTTPKDYLTAYSRNDPTFAPRASEAFQAGLAVNLAISYARTGEKDAAKIAYQTALGLLTDQEMERRTGITRLGVTAELERLQSK